MGNAAQRDDIDEGREWVHGDEKAKEKERKGRGDHGREVKTDTGASHGHEKEGEKLKRQRPEDEVDEAGMESFPASDPPGHGSTGA